jgi:hypothetical protein
VGLCLLFSSINTCTLFTVSIFYCVSPLSRRYNC